MITVLVSCKQCSVTNEKVTCRTRYLGEDLLIYMRHVRYRIYTDHQNKHPYCRALLNAEIPILSEKGIGYE